MKDQRDTPEFEVSYAAYSVGLAVSYMRELAIAFPHLVRQEIATLSNANDELAELVAKLTVKEAAE